MKSILIQVIRFEGHVGILTRVIKFGKYACGFQYIEGGYMCVKYEDLEGCIAKIPFFEKVTEKF